MSWLLRLVELARQWCSRRRFWVAVTTPARAGRKKQEDIFWTCEDKELKGLGISLDDWGRAEGGVRGDLAGFSSSGDLY